MQNQAFPLPINTVDVCKRFKPTKRQLKAARMLANGENYIVAFTTAGYSLAQARKGAQLIRERRGLREALLKEIESFTPEIQRGLIIGRLIWNITHGEDRAVRSCQILGKAPEIGMFK